MYMYMYACMVHIGVYMWYRVVHGIQGYTRVWHVQIW